MTDNCIMFLEARKVPFDNGTCVVMLSSFFGLGDDEEIQDIYCETGSLQETTEQLAEIWDIYTDRGIPPLELREYVQEITKEML